MQIKNVMVIDEYLRRNLRQYYFQNFFVLLIKVDHD